MTQLEQQIQTLTDQFEDLADSILKSQSPKAYQELLAFFRKSLNPNQMFFWTEKPQTQKQKFLSLQKTQIADFESIRKSFQSFSFQEACYVQDGGVCAIRLSSEVAGEFYCFYLEGIQNPSFHNDLIWHVFTQRLHGILKLSEKLVEIQSLNYIDDVTGLYNQRYLNILLDQEIERYKRSHISFCVLFIDVDHFKMVNDKNGHMVGSQILKEIGGILKNCVRAVDFCFRYGGDEFLLVLTNTSTQQAMTVANRVCESVAQTAFAVQGKAIKVTLSIGVACFPEHAQSKEKVLQVADEAMYCGKNSSRNIVYLAG